MSALRRVAVRVARDDAERVGAALLELVPAGLEVIEHDEVVELAVYLEADTVDDVLAAYPGATLDPVAEGWEDAWRDYHRPAIAGGLWVGPPWETPPDPTRAIVIDPGRAFGTGAHPTTRLCIDLLAALGGRGSLLDVGCGSGVLAIAGCRLGFAPVLAVDIDPVAVATTEANAIANGVAIEASLVDARCGPLPVTDVAVANVVLRPVEEILVRVDAVTAITSGYVASDTPVAQAWRHLERRTLQGWAADLWARS